MTVRRIKTSGEARFWLLKLLFGMIAFPCLVFFGVAMLWLVMSADSGKGIWQYQLLTALTWLAVLAPLSLFISNVMSRRRLLKRIKGALQKAGIFNPDKSNEMYHEGDGKYFGIDIDHGTILYIHRIRRGQVDVVGLTMADWISRELEGSTLRLYTKFPELPRIEISTPWAQRWYDTLGAMEYKRYSTPVPFSQYVSQHVEALERDNKIHIPKLA
jgi:hypothetical protein